MFRSLAPERYDFRSAGCVRKTTGKRKKNETKKMSSALICRDWTLSLRQQPTVFHCYSLLILGRTCTRRSRIFFFAVCTYYYTNVDNLILLCLTTVRAHRRRVLLWRERVISVHKTRNYDRNVDIFIVVIIFNNVTLLLHRTGNAIKVRCIFGLDVRTHARKRWGTRVLICIRHGRRPSSFVKSNLLYNDDGGRT